MKGIAIAATMLIVWCGKASAQNTPPEAPTLFQLPELELRLQPGETETQHATKNRQLRLLPTAVAASQPGQLSINGSATDKDLLWAKRLELGGYLKAPEPSTSKFVRWTDAILLPERVRVRKTSVSCSVVTAVKRKNPLCLLSPRLLDLSW